jgi:hypothetical protein
MDVPAGIGVPIETGMPSGIGVPTGIGVLTEIGVPTETGMEMDGIGPAILNSSTSSKRSCPLVVENSQFSLV